jgi:magnesium-transporting ATPase (P-type)
VPALPDELPGSTYQSGFESGHPRSKIGLTQSLFADITQRWFFESEGAILRSYLKSWPSVSQLQIPSLCPGDLVRRNPLKKSEWENGLWVTHAALVLGAVSITVGIAKPVFYQLNVFSFLAFAVILLSTAGIAMSLWRIERRSRRLRAPMFWFALVANLILLVAVSFLYLRSLSLAPMQKTDSQIPASPESL